MNDLEGYPNQKYGWVKENNGSWSLYAPDGTKVIGSAGNTVQVPSPVGATDAATKAYADSSGGGGGSLPSQWSVDGDGNLDITPSGDGTALALQIKSPLSLDDNRTIFEIDADTGASTVFYVAGDGAYVCDDDGNPYVGFRPDGSIALGPTLGNAGLNLSISGARIDLPSGGTLKVYSSDGHELLNVEDGGFLSFKNTSGQYVFQARNDGSVHIPTGTTIQADL